MFRGEIFRATAGVQRLAIFSIFRFKQKEADVTKREKLFYFVLKPSACRATTNREPPPSLCSAACCGPRGNRRLGAHEMGNNSGDYLLCLLEVIDESLAIV